MEMASNDKDTREPIPFLGPSQCTAAPKDGSAKRTIAIHETGHGATIPLHRAKNPHTAAPNATTATTLHCLDIAGSV